MHTAIWAAIATFLAAIGAAWTVFVASEIRHMSQTPAVSKEGR